MSDVKSEEIKKNILSPSQWTRILFMAFYAVACWVLTFVLGFIIAAQVLISLITGKDNASLRDLGHKLADYFHDALKYLVYASDDKPPPFNDSEGGDEDDDVTAGVHTEPANDPDPEVADADNTTRDGSAGRDDVFADISFTETAADSGDDETRAEPAQDQEPGGDSTDDDHHDRP